MSKSYSTTFKYRGSQVSLLISPYFPYVGRYSKFCFQVLINNFFIGNIFKNDEGVWVNLDTEVTHSNIPFVLDEKHYQRLGEIIERELPEYS